MVEATLGGLAGLVVGAIAALNALILMVGDYGLSPGQVFDRSPLAAVVALLLTCAGAAGGAVMGSRLHRPR